MDKDNSGVLFTTVEKKSETSPDRTGHIVIGKDVLDALVKAVKAGGVAKIGLSAWENESKAGRSYLGLKAKVWVDRPAKDDDLFSK